MTRRIRLAVALGGVFLALVVWAASAGAAQAATWCGTVAPTDRSPQVSGGQSVHTIYAVPADLPDRTPQVAQQLLGDAEKIEAWWRREDPTRTLRFDNFPFPCGAQLDVTMLRLPQSSFELRPVNGRFEKILDAMIGARLTSRYVKYLVYYDGPSDPLPSGFQVCGQGGQLASGSGVSMVYLGSCAGVPTAPTAAHELLHGLGAVPLGAAHPCPNGDVAHVCDSPSDILYPFASGQSLDALALDVGRDDYYGHSGAWLDVQDSPWLVFLGSQIRLALELTGSGSVRSDIPGLDCSAACTSDWNGGTKLALSATPAKGQRFVRWTGVCSGAGACSVDLTQAASVGAVFAAATYPLRVATTGRGTVRGASGAIVCGTTCTTSVRSFAATTLTATPAKGWRFRSWSGACRGTRPRCVVPMTGPSTARATFVRRRS